LKLCARFLGQDEDFCPLLDHKVSCTPMLGFLLFVFICFLFFLACSQGITWGAWRKHFHFSPPQASFFKKDIEILCYIVFVVILILFRQ